MKYIVLINFVLFSFQGFSQSEKFTELQQQYEHYLKMQKEGQEDHPWPTIDEDSKGLGELWLQNFLNDLNALPTDSLDQDQRINLDLIKLLVSDELFQKQFNSHRMPLNSEGGFLAEVVYSIQGFHILNEEIFDYFMKKLNALPEYFEMRKEHMIEGQSLGRSSPKLVVNNCIKLLDHFLAKNPEETFFLQPVSGHSERTEVVLEVVKNKIIPAYKNFRDFLKNDYLFLSPEKVGVSGIKGGKKYYEQRVRYFTTMDISPQEVFEVGQMEVKRIRAEMEAIIDSLNFDGSFADFLQFLRTDDQFYCETGDDLLEKASWITKRMEGQLPKYFGKLPWMPLTVTPVPAALAPNYTGGRYSPGSYKNNKAGEYWVNTYNLPSRPLYVLPALSLHEGVPGHHLQIMLAAELEDVPEFRRSTYLSAYGEGWALYTEYLGKEAGIYTTAYEDFGRLTYEMWRACRLVVDPGMHYMGWTREQAIEFMSSNTALSLHEVNTEIDRYIGWPGQAVSYKMGELKIRELRKRAEHELGEKFSIRAFHDLVLSQGAVPLATLEWMVEDWIAHQN